MKVVKKDLKHDVLSVIPENQDDLWLLGKILRPGDVVSGYTLRSIKILQGDREVKSEKKKIFVRLSVEKTDFIGEQLRVGGIIIESSEGDHSHHVFEIEVSRVVTIEREWAKYDLDRIEKAKARHPPVLIVALDDSEASFALLMERLEILTTIFGSTGKSLGEQDNKKYYAEIIKFIRGKNFQAVVLAGPGFTKENVMNLIRKEAPELAGMIYVDSVSYGGEAGIQEVLRRGIVEKVVKESSIAEQSRLVEDFFSSLSKDGKTVYGSRGTREAAEMGAVRELLVSTDKVRDYEEIMKLVEKRGGTVKIIDSHHDAGKRFLAFGGIGAFLRYEISHS